MVAVAAFTGLRESEVRGLQWQDYSGQELFVRRAVWRKNVGDVKTKESKSRAPVIEPLRKLLDAHHRRDGKYTWIFAGPRGFSLNLDNLTKRVIRPALGERFRGWHAFRRGLTNILFEAGVDVEIAKIILRHSDSAVTRRHYLVLKSEQEGREAMKTLENVLTVGNNRGHSAGDSRDKHGTKRKLVRRTSHKPA